MRLQTENWLDSFGVDNGEVTTFFSLYLMSFPNNEALLCFK